MKFLIIIPAHNEEQFIADCLSSLQQQTLQEFACVVVNDGSTDKTREITEGFMASDSRFKIVNLEKSEHQPGAKVVLTFNKGLSTFDLQSFDVICKFDADIIFPQHYLQEINKVYEENPAAGMVSGLVHIEKDGDWVFENLSSRNHVRGPIKSYRRECFVAIKGLRPVLGWDNIDVMLAQKNGWQTVTLKNLWVKHLRPTAYKYKSQKARKLGEYFYNIGLSLPLAIISSVKSSIKNKSLKEFFITIRSYTQQHHPLQLSSEEIQYIRQLRWSEMAKKLKFK